MSIIILEFSNFYKGGILLIDRILDLMKMRKVNAKQLTAELELSNSAITDWKKGKAKPSTEAVIKLADYFGVTTDYILLGKESAVSTEPQLTENEKEILELLHRFDERTQLKFIGRVEAIANEMQTEIKRKNIARAARGQEPLEATDERMKIIGEMADKAPNRAHDKDLF